MDAYFSNDGNDIVSLDAEKKFLQTLDPRGPCEGRKQFTGKLGEHLFLDTLQKHYPPGHIYKPPPGRGRLVPDFVTPDAIYEVKFQMYKSTGTAQEKIMAVPFKYASLPRIYGRPLIVVCMAGAEKWARMYGLFGDSKCDDRNKQLEYWKELNIFIFPFSRMLDNK